MRDEAADVEIDGRRAANGTIPLIDDGREHRVIVRSESVAGWTGRMLAQPLTAEESPTHAHGFVSFAGEGAVLLDDA